ncbi:hypothetical protein A0H81_10869 [Grifola frondosa]|uniref:Uncharacterized protein n=1 Tax=Grifola frondosa TaxID=5627 RepID=A0A1C7LYN1_GRIFR|nr:hypothetical protein A0H81_10869 [Grifola frondosa]
MPEDLIKEDCINVYKWTVSFYYNRGRGDGAGAIEIKAAARFRISIISSRSVITRLGGVLICVAATINLVSASEDILPHADVYDKFVPSGSMKSLITRKSWLKVPPRKYLRSGIHRLVFAW